MTINTKDVYSNWCAADSKERTQAQEHGSKNTTEQGLTMIDYEQLQEYICECDHVVDCDITAGEITGSTETTCKGFCRIKLTYDNMAVENHECESYAYNWDTDAAVAACLNDIALKVSNLTIGLYLRGIAAGIFCRRGE
ncbi:MAG: hypothetical protein [Bacteriophage sp.]|nr:MAG: hypothetical protein [Bacteriophage sp.]